MATPAGMAGLDQPIRHKGFIIFRVEELIFAARIINNCGDNGIQQSGVF